MLLAVVWVVLMILWLVLGNYDFSTGNTTLSKASLLPWACVLILGITIYRGIL